MSDYPIWWDTELTIFNKYEDAVTNLITWYKHTVSNCFWKYVGDKVTVGNTVLETNNIICRIPQDDAFLENYLWVSLPNYEMGNYFTLSQGDIIVKGNVSDVIDEYQSGHRSSDLLAKYKKLQGCMTIERFSINIGSGRNNPHYYIKGI